MPDAVAFIQWDNYEKGINGKGFFATDPLVYSSRQDRLHKVTVGNRLWLASRHSNDEQHYFVGILKIESHTKNPVGSELAQTFGEFAVQADRSSSINLLRSFPADGLLRALHFETGKPIKFGASVGQSLQTIRVLNANDELVLDSALQQVARGNAPALDAPFGLWTKCDAVFADYFWTNWRSKQVSLAFLLYDSPPVLKRGAPVFIHSDKRIRIVASFQGSQYVTGYKPTTDSAERLTERDRIWAAHREATLNPPSKNQFDKFWDSQHGVRSLFLMENLIQVPVDLDFKTYGRALEWGYPMGVGYRYLSLSQCLLLLRATNLSERVCALYLEPLTTTPH